MGKPLSKVLKVWRFIAADRAALWADEPLAVVGFETERTALGASVFGFFHGLKWLVGCVESSGVAAEMEKARECGPWSERDGCI
jgi:hypothetical protein